MLSPFLMETCYQYNNGLIKNARPFFPKFSVIFLTDFGKLRVLFFSYGFGYASFWYDPCGFICSIIERN